MVTLSFSIEREEVDGKRESRAKKEKGWHARTSLEQLLPLLDDFETPLPNLLLLRLDRLQLLLGLVTGHTLRHEGALVAGRRVLERLGLVSGHLLKGQTEIQCNRPALISTSYNQCRGWVHSIENVHAYTLTTYEHTSCVRKMYHWLHSWQLSLFIIPSLYVGMSSNVPTKSILSQWNGINLWTNRSGREWNRDQE